MNFSLHITSAAHRDLVHQGEYLAERNPAVARRFLAAVRTSCQRLQSSPDLGEVWNEEAANEWTYRCWAVRGFEKYVIFYRICSGTIEISRVLHSAQDANQQLGIF